MADKQVPIIMEEVTDPEELAKAWARGTARHDSDVDLLVVMPVTGSKRETQIAIRCALHDIYVAKDIIVATPDEVERRQNLVGTIIRPALREGKVLYARGRRTPECGPTMDPEG